MKSMNAKMILTNEHVRKDTKSKKLYEYVIRTYKPEVWNKIYEIITPYKWIRYRVMGRITPFAVSSKLLRDHQFDSPWEESKLLFHIQNEVGDKCLDLYLIEVIGGFKVIQDSIHELYLFKTKNEMIVHRIMNS